MSAEIKTEWPAPLPLTPELINDIGDYTMSRADKDKMIAYSIEWYKKNMGIDLSEKAK